VLLVPFREIASDRGFEPAAGNVIAWIRALCRMGHVTKRELVSSGAVWEPVVGYSRAVRVGPWVSVAGTTAAAAGGGAVGGDDIGAQTRAALRRIVAALAEVGAGVEHVVRTRIYVTDISRWEEVGRAHGEVFGHIRPAATMVEVSRLIDPALLVEIEADAVVSPDTGADCAAR
jgi:enamine deaminase RidA (YjgF/YER057c/UK114 family)